ncbi:MAG: DUF4256 domain-containing protein, partial [Nitrospira sp.]|nr:DUF4256 domain-containing protein [Nitrospira sp.]
MIEGLYALAVEELGGEPDVVSLSGASKALVFCDCSAESPAGRRSLCYDNPPRTSAKANKPKGQQQSR